MNTKYYCQKCGSELLDLYYKFSHYDKRTGLKIYELFGQCPNNDTFIDKLFYAFIPFKRMHTKKEWITVHDENELIKDIKIK